MDKIVSIIIVNWNTDNILASCLKSLFAIEWVNFGVNKEIFVVDNASEDASVEMVQKSFPEVNLIENKSNIGFGPAVNQASKIASGSIYLISNADVVYNSSAIGEMLYCLDSESTFLAAAPGLVDMNQNSEPSAFSFPNLYRLALEQLLSFGNYGEINLKKIKEPKKGNSDEQKSKRPRFIEVDWVLGACFMIKSEFFKILGGFCDKFYMYSEEIDLFFRLKKKGGKVFFLPDVSVIHVGRASTSLIADKMLIRQTLSTILFFSKNHGKLSGEIAKALIIIGQILRFCMFEFLSIISSGKKNYKKKNI